MYKLRIYDNSGNLKTEEFFEEKSEMDARYRKLASCMKPIPTAWKLKNGEYERLLNY